MAKDPAEVTKAPTPKSLTYNGQAQALVTAGEAKDGTMQHALGTDATIAPTGGWSTAIPTGTDRYEVYEAYCGKKFGKKPVKVIMGAGVTSTVIKKLDGKKLNLKKNFEVYVVAYKTVDGVKQKLGKTVTAHIIGRKNTAYTNVKAIKLKEAKTTIKKGKTWKIKATVGSIKENAF